VNRAYKGVILTSELDNIARQGLDDLRAVFAGKMDGKTLVKANMVLKLLGVSKGRYSAETNRMALMFRIAKAANVSSTEFVSMLRQVMGVSPRKRQRQLAVQVLSGTSIGIKRRPKQRRGSSR